MYSILLFGSTGLLGSTLYPILKDSGYNVITVGRSHTNDKCIDICNIQNIYKIISEINPDKIINLVGATNVDRCEEVVSESVSLNALIPEALSKAIKKYSKINTHLIHISTDQVYSGIGPHKEENANPINVYGLSKLLGEYMTDKNSTTILRTNFYGKSKKKDRFSFSDWVVDSLKENKIITLYDDVYFSALNMYTLCDIIVKVIESEISGIFNTGTCTGISKAEFAIYLAELLNLNTEYAKIGKSSDIKRRASRPNDMRMNVRKIEESICIKMPDIMDEIKKTAKEYQ